MLSTKKQKKIRFKQRKASLKLLKDGIILSTEITPIIAVLNAGLLTSISAEELLEIFLPYGTVSDIVLIPNKAYAFIKYTSSDSALKAMENIHGYYYLKNCILLLSYVTYVPDTLKKEKNKEIPGLKLYEQFINTEEEDCLLNLLSKADHKLFALKHRSVLHFGFDFIYGSNAVDVRQSSAKAIPLPCFSILQRALDLNIISKMPNQLTVNIYEPGEGIPLHIDSHSSFENEIICISLCSDIIMDFKMIQDEVHVPILLPRYSLLVMSDESRYAWKHGIIPRSTDIVHNKLGYFSISPRRLRVSFTFRSVQCSPCTCSFKNCCDSSKMLSCEALAEQMENVHVHDVYEKIADHFNETRYKPWPAVINFISSLPYGSFLLDIGCGNGRNMSLKKFLFEIGCDRSISLLNHCCRQGLNVIKADCLHLPIRNSTMDACLCIAVIHHLASPERRFSLLLEIVRVLKTDGQALITVWAQEQYNSVKRKTACSHSFVEPLPTMVSLPVNEDRSNFEAQDIYVPWKPNQANANTSHLRYYHVFHRGEIEELCMNIPNVKLEKQFWYDKGNWIVILRKT